MDAIIKATQVHDFLDFELMSNFTLCRAMGLLPADIILYWVSLLLIALCAFPGRRCAVNVTLNRQIQASERESELHAVNCKLLSQNYT